MKDSNLRTYARVVKLKARKFILDFSAARAHPRGSSDARRRRSSDRRERDAVRCMSRRRVAADVTVRDVRLAPDLKVGPTATSGIT